MGSRLQQVLRSLCFNSGWKYAVFWKLKHRARMMFTWEDAYYDSSLNEGPYSHDPLGLAVAKMSYQVYSLGEGIVGQVAVSGKHSWIFLDQLVADSSAFSGVLHLLFSPFILIGKVCVVKYCGGWQTQFSAGIKAIVVVIPHGVGLLGSPHKVCRLVTQFLISVFCIYSFYCVDQIAEDLKLVDHIRNVFSELQDPLAAYIPSSIKSNTEHSCLSDSCAKNFDSTAHDCPAKLKGSFQYDEVNLLSKLFSSPGESESGNLFHTLPPRWALSNKTLKMKMLERTECLMPGNEASLPSSSENILTRQLGGEEMDSLNNPKCGGETSDSRNLGKKPEVLTMPSAGNVRIEKSNLYNASLPIDGSQMVTSNLPLVIHGSSAFQDQGNIHIPELPSMQLRQDFQNLELPIKSNQIEVQISPFSFCAGSELYEALAPSFKKQNDCAWEAEKHGSDMAIEISEGMDGCSMLVENSDMHLLDRWWPKLVTRGMTQKVRNHIVKLGNPSTAEKAGCTSVGTTSSAGYSFDRETSNSLNSVTYGVESLKGIRPPVPVEGVNIWKGPKKQLR
ncbi:hypothetical protein CDL12_26642 [Handroanthus impetiginosus]|uniref:Transcription factor MYC/MYB N-terminal domain-containing protein n=1 Tax=Handroanthus impetiginosus TaxID=429701 RepID=A0A2G9G6B4_9LAMI|nr:hypothetical protein CDL12_26642 [Handroanthus impetiginosus]